MSQQHHPCAPRVSTTTGLRPNFLADGWVPRVVGITMVLSVGLASQRAASAEAPTAATRPVTEAVWRAPQPSDHASALSRIVYLNNCKPNGCMVRPGNDDARNNTSSIIGRAYTIQPFAYPDSVWNEVVTCVRETFAPFNVKIVAADPGPSVEHMEVFVAGRPTDIGKSNGIGGVAPWNCNYIPRSVSYAFANVYNGDVNEICAVAAQEFAHTLGLEHVAEASDPLTYLPYRGRRRFKDAQLNCGSDCVGNRWPNGRACVTGTDINRACDCTGGNTQNAVQAMKALFGSANLQPPTVSLTTPRNGEKVQANTPVRVEIMHELGLSKAELRIDGTVVTTLTTQPFAFNVLSTTTEGKHRLTVKVYDVFELAGEASVDVEMTGPCESASDCAATQTCIGGRCVLGPGQDGGLGDTCAQPSECASRTCGDDGSGDKHCVEACSVSGNDCPTGFQCLSTGEKGVCWPNAAAASTGGCQSSSSAPPAALWLLVIGGLLVLARRRV